MAETAWPVLAQTYTYYGPQVWEFHVVQLMAGVMSGTFIRVGLSRCLLR
jgi:hypothetical protein